VLAVLHDLNMAARYADRVAIVEKGRLTALGPTETTLDPALLSAVFATPIVRVEACRDPGLPQSRSHIVKLCPLGHKPAGFLDDMMP